MRRTRRLAADEEEDERVHRRIATRAYHRRPPCRDIVIVALVTVALVTLAHRFYWTRCFLIDLGATLGDWPTRSVPLVSTQAQLDRFVQAHRPALLHGALLSWPALSKWSPEFFAAELGEQPVEVYTWGRSGSDWRRTRLRESTLAEYVVLLQRHGGVDNAAGIGAPYLQEDEWLFAENEVCGMDESRALVTTSHPTHPRQAVLLPDVVSFPFRPHLVR